MQPTIAMKTTPPKQTPSGTAPAQRRNPAPGKAASPSAAALPWYRHRWPWLLAIAPAVALIGGFVTLWLAMTTSDSLVVDDYYREGRAINQQFARDRLAAALGLHGELRFDSDAAGDAGTVSLRLSAERGSAWPPELALRVAHATIASLDREYRLEHVGDGRYRAAGAAPRAQGGRWLVQLEDPGRTWRLVAPSIRGFDVPIELQADTP